MTWNRGFSPLVACGIVVWAGTIQAAGADSLATSIVESAKARGGLCIHVGCGDGALTGDLAKSGQYLVHGLSPNANHVTAARRRIETLGLYGVASVDQGSLSNLPYADNLANLIVVDDLSTVLKYGGSLREVFRVLAPLGVAYVGTRAGASRSMSEVELRGVLNDAKVGEFQIVESAGVWARIVKPRPKEMDQWTHSRHGPDRNPVAEDTLVEPPNNLRWIYGPLWRGTSGIHLSANGRNIYADGTVRDAFNGLRVCSLRSPGKYKYVTPRLAIGDRIYLTAPRASQFLQAADATTGKIVLTFERIRNPVGLAFRDGNLIFASSEGTGSVVAATGKLNWINQDVKLDGPVPRTVPALVVGDDHVFVQVPRSQRTANAARLVCLNGRTGRLVWQKSGVELQGRLLFYERKARVVICGDEYRTYPKHVYAYAAGDGGFLWKSPPMNEGKSVGVYAIDGLIWCQHNRQTVGLDATTGRVKHTHTATPGTFKCAFPSATTRYVPGGNLGFLDLSKGTTEKCVVDRNACGADPGVLFCNGLTYSFPKQCSCFSMMRGYTAYCTDHPLNQSALDVANAPRLVIGRAYDDRSSSHGKSKTEQTSAEWPAFRHDAQRSVSTDSAVALPLTKLWETNPEEQTTPDWMIDDWQQHPSLSGPTSSAVVAAGMLCVALANSHRVVGLDSNSGKRRWSFTAGGRVIIAPTIADGRCYFGGQDGWAYCLRLSDGQLVWKIRAAPTDRRVLAYGQLESLWPVTGGVLVQNGRAYFTAGRLSNLVGGIIGYAVEARTGKLIWKRTPPTGYEYTKQNKIAPAYRNDVPVAGVNPDGGANVVQLGHPRWIVAADTGEFAKKLAPVPHRAVKPNTVPILASTRDGLTDRSRSQHQGPTDMGHGFLAQKYGDVWAQQLVIDKDRIFGFQLPTIKTYYYNNKQSQFRNELRLVAWDRSYQETWTKPLPAGREFLAMIRAGDTLFAAGTVRNKERPYYRGMLWAYSTKDGTELASVELPQLPAGEGLAAAHGNLYVTLQNGRLLCMGVE